MNMTTYSWQKQTLTPVPSAPMQCLCCSGLLSVSSILVLMPNAVVILILCLIIPCTILITICLTLLFSLCLFCFFVFSNESLDQPYRVKGIKRVSIWLSVSLMLFPSLSLSVFLSFATPDGPSSQVWDSHFLRTSVHGRLATFMCHFSLFHVRTTTQPMLRIRFVTPIYVRAATNR